MSLRFLFFIFFLCLCGLFLGTHGQDGNTDNSTESPLIRIPESIISIVTPLAKRFFQGIYGSIRAWIRGLVSMGLDFFSYLVQSDDTRVAKRYVRSTRVKRYTSSRQTQSGVFSLFSKAFMLPFKAVFGSLRLLPIDTVVKASSGLANSFMSNPIVRSSVQQGVQAAEQVGLEFWKFAKVNVFPRLDQWVTEMKSTNSLPDFVMMPLIELQTLYHLLHLLNIA